MGSLLTDSEKGELQNAFDDLHDTFARPVYYFKEAKTVVLSTNPSFNAIYQQNNIQKTTVTKVIQSGSFNARITYDADRSQSYMSSPEIDSQLKLKLPDGSVRIKVDQSGYNTLKTTKRIDFDDRRFSIESDVRPHGLFKPSYYTFFLLPTDKSK
jgi:hypothetical protein